MKIEKICEYLNNIGILQIENINEFLKIYFQVSHKKYNKQSNKLVLALFSYVSLALKNKNNVYQICKNIINNYSLNQTLYRYRALNSLNNIFRAKLYSKYILFFIKLYYYLYQQKIKNLIIPHKKYTKNNSKDNDKKYITINSSLLNKKKNILIPRMERKIPRKMKKINNITNNLLDNEQECTFTPKINYDNSSISKKEKNNYKTIDSENEYLSSNNNFMGKSNENTFNKIISFKNSVNYGFNNKINNEIEKLISNISKYSYHPNNSKYLPQKTIYRKQFFNLNQSDSYKELNINNNTINNIKENSLYFDKEYNFYQNEKEHIEKVKEKIFQLKTQKMNKMSKECTFSPEINKNSRYINLNKLTYNKNNNDISDEFNISNLNYLTNINRKYNHNYFSSNQDLKNKNSISKNKKINEESGDDFYNIYPNRSNNEKQRYRTYSGNKNNKISRADYSIYQKRKEELPKLFIEQHPFMPNIKYNKNYPVNTTFSERQNQFIINKKKLKLLKEVEEAKMMEELQKRNHSYKIKTEEVIKRLYDKEAIKIKDKLEKEKEEKSRKKKVIDWNKRKKKYKEKYLNDFKKKIIHRNQQNKKNDNININNNSHVDYYRNDKNGNQNFINNNKDEINYNGELLKYKFNSEDLIEFRNINNPNYEKNN